MLAQESGQICIWRMYDSELLSKLPYIQAGVSLPDYRDALVVKALEIEYNIFSVLNRFIDMNFENRRMAYEGKYEY